MDSAALDTVDDIFFIDSFSLACALYVIVILAPLSPFIGKISFCRWLSLVPQSLVSLGSASIAQHNVLAIISIIRYGKYVFDYLPFSWMISSLKEIVLLLFITICLASGTVSNVNVLSKCVYSINIYLLHIM